MFFTMSVRIANDDFGYLSIIHQYYLNIPV